MLRVCLVVTAVVLVAGCSLPVPVRVPSPSVAPPSPSGIVLPPRPRELPLDGVDPCELLTPTQRAELGLNQRTVPYMSTGPINSGRACSLGGDEPRAIAVGLALVTRNGIEAVTAPGTVTDALAPVTLEGFPAIVAKARNTDACFVDIDVADGQLLDVLFRDGGRKPPIPQDQLCRDAIAVAELAMRTLLAT